LTAERPSVLFVCVHNAGRSQMAAGFLQHLAGERVEVPSAGSQPADEVNPVAVQAMSEKGIDISREVPKLLADSALRVADVVITAGTVLPARVRVAITEPEPTRTNAAVPKHSASARCDHEYFGVMFVWPQQYPSDFVCGSQALSARNALALAAMSKSRVAIIGIAWGGRET
jgi:protein-tyrosine-phosphatase